jgi:hypothetical protein
VEETGWLPGLASDRECSASAFDDEARGDKAAIAAAVHERDAGEVDDHPRVVAGRRCREELQSGRPIEFACCVDDTAVDCKEHAEAKLAVWHTGDDLNAEIHWNGDAHPNSFT